MAERKVKPNNISPFHAINLLCSKIKKAPKPQKKGTSGSAIERIETRRINKRSEKMSGRDGTLVPSGLLAPAADARQESRTIFRESRPNRLHENIVLDETGHLVYYSAIGSYQLNRANLSEDTPTSGIPQREIRELNPNECTSMHEVHARTGARLRQDRVDVYGDLQYSN